MGAPRSRGATMGGHGTRVVPAITPPHTQDPPQLSSPGPTPGPSPSRPWGPTSRLLMRQAGPGVTAAPTEWGRDNRWRRCHFNQSLQQLGKGRREARAGGGWDLALLFPGTPLFLHLSTWAPLPSSGRSPDPTALALGLPKLPWTLWVPLGSARCRGSPWRQGQQWQSLKAPPPMRREPCDRPASSEDTTAG